VSEGAERDFFFTHGTWVQEMEGSDEICEKEKSFGGTDARRLRNASGGHGGRSFKRKNGPIVGGGAPPLIPGTEFDVQPRSESIGRKKENASE